MTDDKQRIMRGSIETVIVFIDEDCSGHTCYLSIGNEKKCFVTVTQQGIALVEGGSEITFQLSQEDTLACKAGDCSMQVRTAKDNIAAYATEWIAVSVGEAINKGVLTDVD